MLLDSVVLGESSSDAGADEEDDESNMKRMSRNCREHEGDWLR